MNCRSKCHIRTLAESDAELRLFNPLYKSWSRKSLSLAKVPVSPFPHAPETLTGIEWVGSERINLFSRLEIAVFMIE